MMTFGFEDNDKDPLRPAFGITRGVFVGIFAWAIIIGVAYWWF